MDGSFNKVTGITPMLSVKKLGMEDMTPELEVEICLMYKDPGISLESIVKEYHLKYDTMIRLIAQKHGIPLRQPRRSHGPAVQAVHEPDVDELLAEAKARVAELERLKKSKMIRFEMPDTSTIVIHNVDSNFVRLEGMVKLREFIQTHVPQRG